MKVILIHKTTTGGYVASVNGMKKAEAFGKDEISAIKNLTERLENRNPNWIQRSDWWKEPLTKDTPAED